MLRLLAKMLEWKCLSSLQSPLSSLTPIADAGRNMDKYAHLFEEYPDFFVENWNDPAISCMAWGFAVGDGWHDIVEQLLKDIKVIVDRDGLNFKLDQVKEKFGILRIYVSGANEEIHKLINQAEAESSKVCESCGSTEFVGRNDGGWIKTLCRKCE